MFISSIGQLKFQKLRYHGWVPYLLRTTSTIEKLDGNFSLTINKKTSSTARILVVSNETFPINNLSFQIIKQYANITNEFSK